MANKRKQNTKVKSKSPHSVFLSAFNKVAESDPLGVIVPALEEFMGSLTPNEQGLIINRIGEMNEKEGAKILQHIAQKRTNKERRKAAMYLGFIINEKEQFAKLMLELEKYDRQVTQIIEDWLLLLTLPQREAVIDNIVQFEANLAKEFLISLVQLSNNTERTLRAKALNLL